MEKAQEIFKTANRATRPEKEHILKFMAGTRGLNFYILRVSVSVSVVFSGFWVFLLMKLNIFVVYCRQSLSWIGKYCYNQAEWTWRTNSAKRWNCSSFMCRNSLSNELRYWWMESHHETTKARHTYVFIKNKYDFTKLHCSIEGMPTAEEYTVY